MRKLNLGLIGMMATALAASAQPVKTEAYQPAGVRKPTFTERRKAEKAKRLKKKSGRR